MINADLGTNRSTVSLLAGGQQIVIYPQGATFAVLCCLIRGVGHPLQTSERASRFEALARIGNEMPQNGQATGAVDLVVVEPTELETLNNLTQLYQYDFSEIDATNLADDGRFHALDVLEIDRAYFVRADGQLAGFALVQHRPSKIEPETLVWWMQEFFILRRYRRTGIGRAAASLVIHRHPGIWEVTETPSNEGAIAFWRAVLRTYGCRELTFDDPKRGLRPLQRFSWP